MTDKLLNEEITKQVTELFSTQLIHPVEIIYFSTQEPCEPCNEEDRLLEEIVSTSEKLKLVKYKLEDQPEVARRFKVELAPSLVITGHDGDHELDYGLRFAGIPSGYEFGSFIQGILMVSKRDSGLKAEIRQQLKAIKEPIHLRVFVTPT